MKTFYLTENSDIEFDSENNIRMISGKDEKLQAVKTRLNTNLCEWFLNLNFGLDYNAILGRKASDEVMMIAALYEALVDEPRMTQVESIKVDFVDSRKILLSFKASMDGEPQISFEKEVE